MIIRPAQPDDVDLASRAEPAGANVARSHFARQQAGEATFLIARTEQDYLGGCVLAGDEVKHLFVQPGARGKGVGTALMAAAEQHAAAAGLDHVVLGVEVGNLGARALYERLGYLPTGRTSTHSYTYVDHDGERRQATEVSDELRKDLPG